jgi:hypothetical protein
MGSAIELWLPQYGGHPMRGKLDPSRTDTGLNAGYVAPHP